jgi:hypothetical protein
MTTSMPLLAQRRQLGDEQEGLRWTLPCSRCHREIVQRRLTSGERPRSAVYLTGGQQLLGARHPMRRAQRVVGCFPQSGEAQLPEVAA